MSWRPVLAWLLILGGWAGAGLALPARDAVGDRVRLCVMVEGGSTPLYPAPDGSGRFYLEAREGSRYALRLENRTGERLGVVLKVDGLNVISGEAEAERWAARPGRMYVLDPWGETEVAGWRTSLEEIRRFTFVDERASYAARSGKSGVRLGWIELAVYREVRHRAWPWWWGGDETDRRSRDAAPPAAQAAPEASERLKSLGYLGESYPGTGWGPPARDRVEVVDFTPETGPVECLTLRYEYARALAALGIFPRPWYDRDRLSERERGSLGFARPPHW